MAGLVTAQSGGQSTGCLAGSTDPSNLLNCLSGSPAVLASGQPVNQGPLQATPLMNRFQEPAQLYKQKNDFMARGGMVKHYAGGGGAAPPVVTACIDKALTNAGVPTSGCASASNSQIQNTMQTNAAGQGTLTCAETVKATPIQNSSCQELGACAAPKVTATPVNTSTVCSTAVANNPNNVNAATYCAKTVHCKTPQMTAAQANVCSNELVSCQIAKLTGCLKNIQNGGCAPAWAQPTINATNAALAARGLSTSSIAAGAEVSALQQAALPIAQANANAYLQVNMANLTNQQQADVQNQQALVQTLLSDQAATNAASQFNAQSEDQVNEFMSNLNSQVQMSNAAQINAMNQFNAGQTNSVGEFNANLANNVAQFNSANQLTIAQNNVAWRRNINTLNTAAVNAANQTNAQNEFNLTSTAQNNLWNQWQDQASWANTDAQNALTRAQNMAIASLGQQTAFNLADQAQQTALLSYLGKFGIDVAGGPLSNLLSSAINNASSCTNSYNAVNSGSAPLGCSGCATDTGCTVMVCACVPAA